MAGENPKFNFGQTASSGGGSGSLFGTAGGDGAQTKSIFGSGTVGSGANTPTSSGGFNFGAPKSGAEPSKPLFGSAAPTSTTPGAPAAFGTTPAGGAQNKLTLGGASGNTPSLFSQGAGNTGAPSTFSFGQAKPASPAPTSSAAPAASIFGNVGPGSSAGTPGEAPKTSGGATGSGGTNTLFGNNATPSFGFGNNAPASTAGEQNKPTSTAGLFGSGAPSASKPPGGGLFQSTGAPGGATTPQPNKQVPSLSFTPAGNPPPSSSSLFGNTSSKPEDKPSASFQSQQPQDGSKTAAPFSFPAATSSQPAAPKPSSGPGPSLFAPKPAASGPSAPAAASTGAPTSNLFAGLSGGAAAASSGSTSQPAATSTAAPAFTGFSLGGQSTATSQPSTTTTAPASSGATSAAGGLFGGGATGSGGSSLFPSSSGPSGTAGQTGQTTTTAGSTGGLFGTAGGPGAAASTSGPAPPQQSRLAGKTMDEILTMWSTSLASHQKTFQQLAQQVSTWDRLLVENSSKISGLYSRCFQAERDCSEVERQLSNVEHSQLELETLLDRYEGEVDRMLEGAGLGDGGTGVSGVDAERERTYKTAEHCSTRLAEMSVSLTDMIDEINGASAQLSSASPNPSRTATDDPLTDIVRILNSHLAQLQTIDHGATALQGKVAAAQKEARSLGQSQTLNGDASQWVSDFGQSYLGRR